MDIGSIVSQRLTAIRRLQENPTDAEALTQMYKAQKNVSLIIQAASSSKQLRFKNKVIKLCYNEYKLKAINNSPNINDLGSISQIANTLFFLICTIFKTLW